jgi:hypothetical protein
LSIYHKRKEKKKELQLLIADSLLAGGHWQLGDRES